MPSIPTNWRTAKLGTLAKEMFGGGTPSTKVPDFWIGNIPWLTSKSLGDSIYLTAGEKTISEEAVKRSATHIVPAGNLIFATRVGVGKVVVTKIDVAISQDSTGIVVDPKEVDPTFLAYQLRTDEVQRFVDQNKRGATIQGITRTSLQQVDVSVPPIPEQLRIAHILNYVQTAIDQQSHLIALTRELKSALIHKLFTEGLRGEKQKETDIGLVPGSWEVLPLKMVSSIERGKFTHRPRNAPQFYGGSIPFVQTGDVSNCDGKIEKFTQTLNEEGLRISKMFPAGTILITIAANIGYTGILQFDSACPDSLIGLTPNNRISVEFLQYYLETQQPEMDRLAPRGTQKNINIQFLKPWLIPVPKLDEQIEIAQILNNVYAKRREASRKKALLEELFQTMLHQLMTGQIRVNDLDLPGLS